MPLTSAARSAARGEGSRLRLEIVEAALRLVDDGTDRLTLRAIARAIRQAVLEAASRRERAATMRREVLRMNLGEPDGINVAEELARDRSGER